ncbi:hypothetical protein KFU94_33730 [Chloroflexi bacterium TSY]|nr:hypothetical protein [Chloroflexi bacterium TSY]
MEQSLLLFGYPKIDINGQPIDIKSRKGLALLAYLAVTRQPQSRDTLAGLLWPEYDQTRARANLRRTLYNLNRTPVADWLVSDGEMLQLKSEILANVDVVQFEERLEDGNIEAQQNAVGLYSEDFLSGYSLSDSEPFDEWTVMQRARLQWMVLATLETLTKQHLEAGDWDEAIATARHQLALDNWRESAWQQLMSALTRSGRRNEALTAFAECSSVLRRELDVEPDPETVALAEAIRRGELSSGIEEGTSIVDVDSVVSATEHGELPKMDRPLAPEVTANNGQLAPYRGLFAFREEDAPYFFGREEFTELLLTTVQEQSIVAVIGPSGSGKSSVVYAGLVAQLRDTVDWLIISFRPGGRPFHALAGAFVPLLDPALSTTEQLVEIRRLATALEQGDLTLQDVVERGLQHHAASDRILLIADQFEELFTLCANPNQRQHFLDTLLELVFAGQYQPSPIFTLVLTLRADFLGQALSHRALADAIQEFDVKLGPMTRPELSRAVTNPARLQSVGFESGLVTRILDDVGDEPGNLPLLEFSLASLWEQRINGQIVHSSYDAIGRIDGALARYADEVFVTFDEAEAARRIFIQLVRPGEGTEDTRRIALRNELGDDDWGLITHLADARLVVTGQNADGQETVEVVHEALLRSWGQLRSWMETDREFRVWQERMRSGLRQWEATDKDEGALLRGVSLAEAERWLSERNTDLSQPELRFIQASLVLRERREQEREAQRQRELDAAQELAATEANAAARLRQRAWLLAGAGLVAVLLAAIAALFGVQSNRNATQAEQNAALAAERAAEALVAQEIASTRAAEALVAQEEAAAEQARANAERNVAISRQLVLEVTEQLAKGNLDPALLLAIEAVRSAQTQEAWATLREALTYARHNLRTFSGHAGSINGFGGAKWNADESRILTVSDDHTARVWDAATGQQLVLLSGHTDSVRTPSWNRDESRILTAGDDGTVRIWDAATGAELLVLPVVSSDRTNMAAWSPDDRRILTAAGDGLGRVWDAETGQEVLTLSGHTNFVQEAKWNSTGSRIVTASADGTARIWDATTGEQLLTLSGHTDGLIRASWNRNDSRILTASIDGTAKVWDAVTGENLLTLAGHTDFLWDAIWNRDESRILTTSFDGSARVWDASTGESILTLFGHTDLVHQATWNPDESLIVTASDDDSTRVWNASSGRELAIVRFPVQSAIWSADGRHILIGGGDGKLRIWTWDDPPRRLHELPSLPGSPLDYFESIWNEDESLILTASFDPIGYVRVWEADSGEVRLTLSDLTAGGHWARWNADESRILTANDDGTARIWEAETGEELLIFRGHTALVARATWNRDESHVLTASFDGTERVWDAETGEELLVLSGHTDVVLRATWNVDETRILTDSDDSTAKIWDARSGELLLTLADHTDEVWISRWNKDGSKVLTGGKDGRVRVWDANTGAILLKLDGHQYGISSAHWNAGENRVLTASDDGTARVWNAATGETLLTLTNHTEGVWQAIWNDDETRILTTSDDDTVRIWDARTGEEQIVIHDDNPKFALWSRDGRRILVPGVSGVRQYYTHLEDVISVACKRLPRNLTQEEWRQFMGDTPYRATCPDLPAAAID